VTKLIVPGFPACWSWPVTAGDLGQAQAAANPHMAWVLLSRWQQARCGICGREPEPMDADHVTRLVRGYVCRLCNVREAKAAKRGQARASTPAIASATLRACWVCVSAGQQRRQPRREPAGCW